MGLACELPGGDFSVWQKAVVGIVHHAVGVTIIQLSRGVVSVGGHGPNSKKQYRWTMLHKLGERGRDLGAGEALVDQRVETGDDRGQRASATKPVQASGETSG
jgi:hypothetical protein